MASMPVVKIAEKGCRIDDSLVELEDPRGELLLPLLVCFGPWFYDLPILISRRRRKMVNGEKSLDM